MLLIFATRPLSSAAKRSGTHACSASTARAQPRLPTTKPAMVRPSSTSMTSPKGIEAMTRAAVTRPAPPSRPPAASMRLRAFCASTSATTAGTTGQTTRETIAHTNAPVARPSVGFGGYHVGYPYGAGYAGVPPYTAPGGGDAGGAPQPGAPQPGVLTARCKHKRRPPTPFAGGGAAVPDFGTLVVRE